MKSFFLTGVFLSASLCALSGEPFLRNASFELGTEDWKLVRFAQKESSFRKGVPDRKYKIHGRQSLRIDNPDADTIELTSRLLSPQGPHIHVLLVCQERSTPSSSRSDDLAVRQPLVCGDIACNSHIRIETLPLHVPGSGRFRLSSPLHLGKLGRKSKFSHVVD